MAGIQKTNVARLLDKAKIPYELVPYTVDENNLAADHVAEELGEDINQVFKTLVLHGDRSGHFVCVVPGNTIEITQTHFILSLNIALFGQFF